MTRYELLIEKNGLKYMVDVEPNVPVSLNYQLSDITDPLSRQSSYSKTIILLDTPNNREIFSDISDINSVLDFNPNLKIKSWILVDSIVNFEGFLQIKKFNSSEFGNGYEATIYSDLDNIFKSIGDSFLSDLSLTDLDHTLSLAGITASWTDDLGYLYPIVDYGYNWTATDLASSTGGIVFDDVNTTPFRPAIKSKVIFDRIFADSGYTYESDIISSVEFNKLYELYSIQLKADLFDRYKFTVGLNSDLSIKKGAVTSGNTLGVNPIGGRLNFSNETSPNGDPDNLWNQTSTFGGPYNFVNTIPFQTKQYFYTDMEVWVALPTNFTASYTAACTYNNNIGATDFYGKLTIHKNGQVVNQVALGRTASAGGNVVLYQFNGSQAGNLNWWGHTGTDFQNTTYLGVTVSGGYNYVMMRVQSRTDFESPSGAIPIMGANGYEQVDFCLNTQFSTSLLLNVPATASLFIVKSTKTNTEKSLIYNNISTTIVNNMPVSISKLLPTNVKQRDWLMSIIKMFNLILEPSTTSPNHMIIKTRDDFYSGGQVKDWTKKVDKSQQLEGIVLGDTQNKTFKFKYKDDTDYLNDKYKNKTNTSYSSKQVDIDNDFINGEKVLELLHSPTPITQTPSGSNLFLVPGIYKTTDVTGGAQAQTTFNPRILYYNGLVTAGLPYYIRQRSVATGTQFTTYPQLSHYTDNFDDNSYDLSFGQNQLGYFDNRTETNQNLYERFHSTQFDQLTNLNSRIITVDILLDSYDIYSFKFSDKIFIRDNYYFVNKIIDYNPGLMGTCKIELIKTDATVTTIPLVKRYILSDPIIPLPSKSILDIGFQNDYTLNANRIISNGSYNTIAGSDNVVFGSNNIIIGSVSNSIILGSNQVVTDSGVIVLGAPVVFSSNFIDAGTNEILSPFSENSVVNYISGSRDSIRDLGSFTNIMFISSGRNSII